MQGMQTSILRSETLNLLSQMQSQLPKEEIQQEDLIYKQATQQLKQQQQILIVDDSEEQSQIPFRELYKNVRSNLNFDDEDSEVVASQPNETVIQSYLEKLSDGLEPESLPLPEMELQTDPEKLGKFKKYFVKEEIKQETKPEIKAEAVQPEQESNISTEVQPVKLTLREKLELKKKQVQQPPVVAAIQIKQEEDKPLVQSVGKTTLMKKIEEFKKIKQEKEQQEQTISSEPKETTNNLDEKKQEVAEPQNALRKLLNKKAQERKEQEIAMTQEVQQENEAQVQEQTTQNRLQNQNDQPEDQVIEFNESVDLVSDEPIEMAMQNEEQQEQDESHQEYLVKGQEDDQTLSNDIVTQKDSSELNSEISQSGSQEEQSQNLEQPIVENQNALDQGENEILGSEESRQDNSIDTATNEENIISDEPGSEDQISNSSASQSQDQLGEQEVTGQSDRTQSNEITESLTQSTEPEVVIKEEDVKRTENSSFESNQESKEQISPVNSNYQNEENLNTNDPSENYQITQVEQLESNQGEQTEIETDKIEEMTENTDKQEANVNEDLEQQENETDSDVSQSEQQTQMYQGYVQENNVEVSDYLSEVEEAEKLRKIRAVEEEISKEEELKSQLEQKKSEDEMKLEQLQQEQQQVIEEEGQQEKQIEEVSKQLDQEETQLKIIEAEKIEAVEQNIDNKNSGSTDIEQPLQQQKPEIKVNEAESDIVISSETNYDESTQFDEEPSNGFNIEEYNSKQQLQPENTVPNIPYSESSTLFNKNDYITQIGDGDDAVIVASEPAQLEEISVDFSKINNQVNLGKDVLIKEVEADQNIEQQLSTKEEKIENQDSEDNVLEVKSHNSLISEQNDQMSDQDESSQQQQDNIENNAEDIESDNTKQEFEDLSSTPTMIPMEALKQVETEYYDPEVELDRVDIVEIDNYNEETALDNEKLKSAEAMQNIQNHQDLKQHPLAEKISPITRIEPEMRIDDNIAIESIEFDTTTANPLVNQNKRNTVFIETLYDIEYDQESFKELSRKQKKQEKQKNQEKMRLLKDREQKQRKLEQEREQEKLRQEMQQKEVLKQQEQLIELQNQQLLNKQRYKMKQVSPVTVSKDVIQVPDNSKYHQTQQSQIQIINQRLDQEFSFQQIVTKVDDRENDNSKKLRGNNKHVKFTDINFFQLTEKQQKNNIKSQDLFEAIKNEMIECDLNKYTLNLCNLCQTDVVYEINDDNWYLIGIAYGLKRHFQNLLNTIQFHFKNSKIYTSFNKEQQVCVTLGDSIDIENLEEILKYYNNSTLSLGNHFARVPQQLRGNFAQMKVDLNQHRFIDFHLDATLIKQVQYNGFTVTEQHLSVGSSFNYTQMGSIQYPGAIIPYKLQLQQNVEELSVELNTQVYERVLSNYLSRPLLSKLQMAYTVTSKFLVIDNDDSLEFEIIVQK